MDIAVLGTGMVGQAVAGRLATLGHHVTVGTRDVTQTLARSEPDGMGNPPFSAWASERPAISVATFRDAAAGAELVVNATNGGASIAVLEAAGSDALAGKVLIDIANPLDFSQGMPPTLFVKDTDSLGEQIQRAFPDARVVKTLNIVTAGVMVDPAGCGVGDHSMFVAGNDSDAKAVVTSLLGELGHDDVIDIGDITSARGTEMMLPVWLRLMSALGTPMFAFKVVR